MSRDAGKARRRKEREERGSESQDANLGKKLILP